MDNHLKISTEPTLIKIHCHSLTLLTPNTQHDNSKQCFFFFEGYKLRRKENLIKEKSEKEIIRKEKQ